MKKKKISAHHSELQQHRKQPSFFFLLLSERPIRNTHVQPPHPLCAGDGDGGGGGGVSGGRGCEKTKEIVGKGRKHVGESKHGCS